MTKLLLTSSGLTNDKLRDAFDELTDKTIGELKVAFIITASLGEAGDKAWVVKDLNNLYMAGVAEVDIVDIAGSPKSEWLPRLKWADVIWVEGGDTRFLMYHSNKSGFTQELPTLLQDRLYIGVSAGSMIMGECLPKEGEVGMYPDDKFREPYKSANTYLGYVPIHIIPHFRDDYFRTDDDKLQSLTDVTDKPIYALDDSSAIVVQDGDVQRVVTEGAWKVFLKHAA